MRRQTSSRRSEQWLRGEGDYLSHYLVLGTCSRMIEKHIEKGNS